MRVAHAHARRCFLSGNATENSETPGLFLAYSLTNFAWILEFRRRSRRRAAPLRTIENVPSFLELC